jgi:hypothetical protein
MTEQKSRSGRDFCISDLDPVLREAVAKLAQSEFRSQAKQMQVLVREALAARGILTAE